MFNGRRLAMIDRAMWRRAAMATADDRHLVEPCQRPTDRDLAIVPDHIFLRLLNVYGMLSSGQLCFFITLVSYYTCRSEQTFGTRTYRPINNLKDILNIQDCKAEQLWVLSRAGPSWPPGDVFQRFSRLRQLSAEVVTNHEGGRGALPKEVAEGFKTLNFPPKGADAGVMTDQGKDHFRDLAQQLKQSLPHLFTQPYSPEDYEIRYINTLGSSQSMESFTKTIFGEGFDISTVHGPAEIDILLDAPNICESWKNEAYSPKSYWRLIAASIYSPLSSVRKEVSKRLGFTSYLTDDSVLMMYLACGLQKAMDSKAQSTWCAAFSEENLKVLEYLEDRFYYKVFTGEGNGNLEELNSVMPCRLYQELIKQISRIEHKRMHPNGIFYFTDEKTILLLLHGLGFLKDAKINDFSSADERTFRTSELAPLGANLLIVIDRCTAGEEFRIVFYLNGKQLKLKTQENNSVKKFKHDLDYFSSTQMQCHVDFCRNIDKSQVDITKVFINS